MIKTAHTLNQNYAQSKDKENDMEQILVDFSAPKGRIKPMHSVNNGPAGSKLRGDHNFDTYAAAGFPYARNHDASFCWDYGGEHTVDVHRIFKRFEADENDPASYAFESTDRYLASFTETGTKVFYRLGASIEHDQKYGTYPPPDFEKWARICEHIIRHYTEGWADGFYYDIEYWEIWNEPDCMGAAGGNPCWQGTPDEFMDLFCTTVRYLKERFPHLKFGGPAFMSCWWIEWDERFFSAVKERNVPLDFFSFHGYAKDPYYYRQSAYKAREIADSFGFTDIELILNEWNYVKGWLGPEYGYSMRVMKSLKGASFVLASMMCAQDSPMDHFMYYDARPCHWNGLFDFDTLAPRKAYYAFPMFNTLYNIGTEVKTDASPEGPVYVLAAGDGARGAVVLTNYDDKEETAPTQEIKLSLAGLGEGVWKVQYSLVDEEHNLTPIREERFATGGMDTYLQLPLYSMMLITLEKE